MGVHYSTNQIREMLLFDIFMHFDRGLWNG